ncbi:MULTISPECIES: anti-phage dCTP deaminase [unclassified Sinorhizobium]|uniref:anti-phage dCTP deaminase n=1 Tax=unclassified Sinorhizobium TaxID=2613772 RepID=UPI0024C31BAB|nr:MULTISPECIES: anti-phage dCTP deaminase [unclassified Sinorhizobium]MDK1376756.1 anti-phage dCTP deaminase [Sinorhizobium sp. 6-70]MDK1479528.1 anti-phage dCTP deaminase [Sinorhizobium sp. 6-117]
MTTTATVDNPEIVVGLVGPIGVDLDAVVGFLTEALAKVQYASEVIHITQVMRDVLPQIVIDESSYVHRYASLISHADTVRRSVNNNAALACLAISDIRRVRTRRNGKRRPDQPALGTAYIIRQLKREEEIALLRAVYGRKFVQVSIYSDPDERRRQIMRKIKGFGTAIIEDEEAEKEAIGLIARDHNEVDEVFGQRVSDVFPLGDVFVPGQGGREAKEVVERFVNAFFGHNGLSPTKAEYGMYAAAGASLRSLDLSRQIGAAIFSERGEVITLGCNEVPKAFGGTYWCDDAGSHHRDFEEGEDGNHSRKLRLLHDLVDRMGQLGYLSDKLEKEGATTNQVKKMMTERLISDSRVMDIIEFGRIIHAEMSAITDAARKGKALADSIMFTTTFPCHMCAKHIVSSGIRRVVFLEPYPKSHAKDLHEDSITFSPSEQYTKVLFEPFIGISPRRYRDIFEKKKRKGSDGKAIQWAEKKPVPRIEDRSPSYIANEEPAISLVVENILNLSKASVPIAPAAVKTPSRRSRKPKDSPPSI